MKEVLDVISAVFQSAIRNLQSAMVLGLGRRARRRVPQRCHDRFLGQIHRHAGRGYECWTVPVEAGGEQFVPPSLATLEIDGDEGRPIWRAQAEVVEPLSFEHTDTPV